jgi:hypothetical protein
MRYEPRTAPQEYSQETVPPAARAHGGVRARRARAFHTPPPPSPSHDVKLNLASAHSFAYFYSPSSATGLPLARESPRPPDKHPRELRQ